MKFNFMCLHAVKLQWEGLTNSEISSRMKKSDAWVSTVLNSPEAKEIYKRLENKVLDTSAQVQTVLQAAAPLALERKINLMFSPNDSVANKAAQEILELAGHVATRQVEIRRGDHIEEEFRGKSEAEIRREILEELTDPNSSPEAKTNSTLLLH